MAVAPELNRLYVLMHPDHAPHKWEDPSQTIWVYDLKTRKKVDTMDLPGEDLATRQFKEELERAEQKIRERNEKLGAYGYRHLLPSRVPTNIAI